MVDGDKTAILWGERPILGWFDGRYTRCFVALHPFFRIPGMDPAQCIHGAVVLEASDMPEGVGFLEWNDQQYQSRLEGRLFESEDVDEAARLYGERISWREICHDAGFGDHNALTTGLLSSTHALRAAYHDAQGAKRIEDYCATEKIFPPTDNEFQPLMHHDFCALFDAYGVQRVVMKDEYGFVEETVSLSYVKECGIQPTREASEAYNPTCVLTEDQSLRICVEFDCFVALIFEQDDRLPKEVIENLFEGFWCTPDTSLAWRRQPLQPLTGGSYKGG